MKVKKEIDLTALQLAIFGLSATKVKEVLAAVGVEGSELKSLEKAKTKLYIWDNAVFVLASSLGEARELTAKRLIGLKSVKEMVCQEQPLEIEAGHVHLVFHESTTS